MATLFADRPCLDPESAYRACVERRLPTDWFGKPNAFTVPLGRGPGTGFVLLRLQDLTAISLTADHDLTFADDAGHEITLKKITLLRATCLTPGADDDPLAAYLCELADRRFHLGRVPVDRGYNVRSADGTALTTGSLNTGVAWTWQQVVQDLATTLGIGTLTLPFTPDATPENLCYYGWWALDALCDVLDRAACALKYDPEGDTFSALRLGDTTATAATSATGRLDQLARDGLRTWDAFPDEPARGWRPEKVRVRFPRRPLPTDGSSPFYTVDVTLSAVSGVASGTFVQLDDDLSALGATGTPSNSAALSTRATERAGDWLRKRQYYGRRLLKEYRDFQPAARTILSPLVGSVGFDDRGGPMRTAVRSSPDGLLEGWGALSHVAGRWPPEAQGSPFHARLVASGTNAAGTTGWTFVRLTLTTGAFADDGGTVTGFVAIPAKIDGTNLCNPAAGLRVWVWPSKTAGYYEFIPYGYADKVGSTYYPGIVSITTQAFKGTKTFWDDVVCRGVIWGQDGADGGALASGTTGTFEGNVQADQLLVPEGTGIRVCYLPTDFSHFGGMLANNGTDALFGYGYGVLSGGSTSGVWMGTGSGGVPMIFAGDSAKLFYSGTFTDTLTGPGTFLSGDGRDMGYLRGWLVSKGDPTGFDGSYTVTVGDVMLFSHGRLLSINGGTSPPIPPIPAPPPPPTPP